MKTKRFRHKIYLLLTLMIAQCSLPLDDPEDLICGGTVAIESISDLKVDLGATLSLRNVSSNQEEYVFVWSIGNERITTDVLNYTFNQEGPVSITLEGTCKTNNVVSSDRLDLNIVANDPVADFVFETTDSCSLGCAIEINNISTSADMYLIDFGDPTTNADEITTSNLEVHSYTYTESGAYTITVEARNTATGAAHTKMQQVKITKEVAVVFQVDMSEVKHSGEPSIYGSWPSSSWNPDSALPLVNIKEDIWQAELMLTNLSNYEYRFLTDFSDESAEKAMSCFEGSNGNRLLSLDVGNANLELVCFEECSPCSFTCGDIYYDPRNAIKYSTKWFDEEAGHDLTKVGVCWMTENLNLNNGLTQCYDFDVENCETYGQLYLQDGLSGVCPNGWQLPTISNWDKLFVSHGLSKTENDMQVLYRGNVSAFGPSGNFETEFLVGGKNSASGGFQFEGLGVSHWTNEGQEIFFDFGVSEIRLLSLENDDIDAAYCRCVAQQ